MTEIIEIRKATTNDAAQIAQRMIFAMEDLVEKYLNGKFELDPIAIFSELIETKNNLYSHENTWVACINHQLVGTITAYDGASFETFRAHVFEKLYEQTGFSSELESETQAGEFYIDTVSVHPNFQRKGIGNQLINTAMDAAIENGFSKIALLVETHNLQAKALYLKLGFQPSSWVELGGTSYEKLVRELPG